MKQEFDYEKLGFKAGLEIHVQLDTKKKLFCRCPVLLRTDEPDFYVKRFFRPVMGEMGEFDKAMLREFEKGLTIIYEGYNDTTCSYEFDETPPFPPNKEAVDIAIMICLLLNCNIVDELHVCRKNYLDGSVPCGFQRTIYMGGGGYIPIDGKKISILHVYLEEEAARKDDKKSRGKIVYYKLDRLGIPLVEIVTGPDMKTPQEVVETARRLGTLLKATGKARRGLGTIRQDINVSIEGGARVELKGVQLLDLIPKAINMEIKRQLELIKIKKELNNRNIKPEDIQENFVDVTQIFKNTKCKFVKKAIERGEKVLALNLKGFGGLLGREIQPNRRFGTEFADRVKAYTTLKGIIHSDEKLISYGFSEEEIKKLFEQVGKTENDAVVIVVGKEKEARRALKLVVERAQMALKGVPEETRQVKEDGTSSLIRELHGQARLYPDTDTPPFTISRERIEEIRKKLPEYPWDAVKRIIKKYNLTKEFAEMLVYDGIYRFFEEIVKKYKLSPVLVASTLLQTLKALHRDGVPVENLTEKHLREMFEALSRGMFAKEAIPTILTLWAKNPNHDLDYIVKEAGFLAISEDELKEIVQKIIQENLDLVKKRGMGAFGPLMGMIMNKVRGKIDGATVSRILQQKLKEVTSSK
ncbi:MAG: Glu-tRNA(Gln) amidotransferase subunit GatE [Candidatus Baldrarchaeia archaeon]